MALESSKTVRVDAELGSMVVHVYGQSTENVAVPMLLVHGFPLDHSMWNRQIETLAVGRMLIVPDLPGCGKSDAVSDCVTMASVADDLAVVISQLASNGPVVYCGLSMGGYIGWELWNRHPLLLSHLILCDTRAANDSPTVAKGRTMTAAKFDAEGNDAESELKSLAETMVGKLFSEETLQSSSDAVEMTRQVMQTSRPATVAAYLRGMAARIDFTNRLSEIDLPTLLLCGEHDVITPPDEMSLISSQMTNSKYVEIKKAGHMAPLEQPDQVNRAIRGFLAG